VETTAADFHGNLAQLAATARKVIISCGIVWMPGA
jgi:hypothetical protein